MSLLFPVHGEAAHLQAVSEQLAGLQRPDDFERFHLPHLADRLRRGGGSVNSIQ
jgi:hypothetical protein